MPSMPLHPALVHLPLALAFIVPFVALALTWALWKGRVPSRAWIGIVVLQAVLLVSGLVAKNFGEREEDRLKAKIPEAALERHDLTANVFLGASGFTLAAAVLVLVWRRPGALKPLTVVTIAGSVLAAGAAVCAGYTGGELIYVHNAAASYVSGNKALAAVDKDSARDGEKAEAAPVGGNP